MLILGYNEEQYRRLSRRLNKKMILIDAYPEGAYTFQNVGIDDYSGGYQIGEYLYSCGYKKALLLRKRRETVITIGGWDSNRRWKNRGDSAVAPDI